jgi:hypothetical protein
MKSCDKGPLLKNLCNSSGREGLSLRITLLHTRHSGFTFLRTTCKKMKNSNYRWLWSKRCLARDTPQLSMVKQDLDRQDLVRKTGEVSQEKNEEKNSSHLLKIMRNLPWTSCGS